MDSLLNNQTDYLNLYIVPWGINLITALVVFVLGRMVAKFICRFVNRLMKRAKVDDILVTFIENILYFALLVVVVIAALDRLGVNTSSVLAVFAAAGLAVGLALKDSLSNFAAGVMLVFFKPFKTGDFIEAGGQSGVVEEIRIFNTMLRTGDNREITLPNSHIYGGTIVNFSARDTRRIDLVFGIGYDDDIKLAKQLIEKTMSEDARILKEPGPTLMVLELADSSVNFAVRPWVNASDYWAVRSDLLESLKVGCDAAGISIPYPQRDVHVYQHENDKATA